MNQISNISRAWSTIERYLGSHICGQVLFIGLVSKVAQDTKSILCHTANLTSSGLR